MKHSPLLPRQTRQLALMDPEEQMARLRRMSARDLLRYDADFESWAHDGQRPPQGEGWRTWLMMAGRGYGKTRAGAEWITSLATQSGRPVRIALVGATEAEVRRVMIEGPAGLLNVGTARQRPRWEPSIGRLRWRGGSEAFVYSAENPEGIRGSEHHFAWCDELAKWRDGDAAWDNLQMTLRAGERPRTLVTTTPKPVALLKRIGALKGTVTTRGRTMDNANLPEEFLKAMAETYGGTRLGRQELEGHLFEDFEGSLWPRELIERSRVQPLCAGFARVVIGVDPPASAHGDACGIVAVGVGKDGIGYVLGDHSVRGMSPEGWARAVAAAAEAHGADRVIVEKNNGGNMVESVLRGVDSALPVTPAHARENKIARAEPVAVLFESGKAKLAGHFPELEDELTGLCAGGRYEGPGRSPDRADAMVWAMSELMLGRRRVVPRVWVP